MIKDNAIAWTIAASDSSAGAGIQADLATFTHFKVHGCSVVTKITAQNSSEIMDSYTLPEHIFYKQLEAINKEFPADAIKISVLGSLEQLNKLTIFLTNYNGFIVYDPVINSATGTILTQDKLLGTIKTKLFPKSDLITPNIPEAEILTKTKINTLEDMIDCGKMLLDMRVKNVLLKGGHLTGSYAIDLFINNSQFFWLISNKYEQRPDLEIHGTGCHLSSAITANLALGYLLIDAIVIAKRYINSLIRNSYLPQKDSGQRYMCPNNSIYIKEDMPKIVENNFYFKQLDNSFLKCGELGLYPVVDSSGWIDKLASYGVTTIQLRIKNKSQSEIEAEIIKSIKIAKKYNLKLFINDYWKLAIKHKAYGIHLGQEDLLTANLELIKAHGLYLGISSHSYYELANALSKNPSYIALGPIFPTTSKIMPWQAQGLDKIAKWQQMINCPLVVIGGINPENIDSVIKAGARNLSMISAITKATDPKQVTQLLLKKITSYG